MAGVESPLRVRIANAICVIRRVVGAPDYDAYLAHCLSRHPGVPPLTREAFMRERLDARYSRAGSRCC
jgi:uncharacterized short protein YbdD (DUF466 family)